MKFRAREPRWYNWQVAELRLVHSPGYIPKSFTLWLQVKPIVNLPSLSKFNTITREGDTWSMLGVSRNQPCENTHQHWCPGCVWWFVVKGSFCHCLIPSSFSWVCMASLYSLVSFPRALFPALFPYLLSAVLPCMSLWYFLLTLTKVLPLLSSFSPSSLFSYSLHICLDCPFSS